MARKQHGRNDNTRWRNARSRAIRAAGGRCQLCFKPLDPSLPAKTPFSTEVDHIVPLHQGGDPYAASNLRAVHRGCHQRRDDFDLARSGWWHMDGASPGCCPHSVQWVDSMVYREGMAS